MLIALLAATTGLAFSGGDDAALARFLVKEFRVPVAVLAESGRVWKKASIPEGSPAGQLRALGSKLGTTRLTPGCLGFSSESWPKNFYLVQRRSQYVSDSGAAKPPIFENGTITFSTQGRAVPLSYAFPGGLPKGVSWHWFYEGAMLCVEAKRVPLDRYVHLIAQAIGSKVTTKPDAYYFDFDPPSYRQRGVSLLDRLADAGVEDILTVEDFRYSACVLKSLSDEILRKGMTSPEQPTVIDQALSGEELSSALARIRRIFPVEEGQQVSQSMASAWKTITSRSDLSKLYAVFYPRGTFAVMVKGKNPGDPSNVF